jgi:hypothetical protein
MVDNLFCTKGYTIARKIKCNLQVTATEINKISHICLVLVALLFFLLSLCCGAQN